MIKENCSLCGCELIRNTEYAKPTIAGRSHATKHHYIAERFFGRSKNRPGDVRDAIFKECPWKYEGQSATFCYDCHEKSPHFLKKHGLNNCVYGFEYLDCHTQSNLKNINSIIQKYFWNYI